MPSLALSAVIVDDEEIGRKNLRQIIESKFPQVNILGEAANRAAAVQLIEEVRPDLVFLDIRLADDNGFDVLADFQPRNFQVIIVSAYSDFGIKGIKEKVTDYLLKPISREELKEAIDKAMEQKLQGLTAGISNDKIAISDQQGFRILNHFEIVYFEASSNYTRVHTTDGTLLVSRPLRDFDLQLGPPAFMRIHKSYLINIQHMRGYSSEEGGIAVMSNGAKLSISKRKHTEFFDLMKSMNILR
ncbi:MAG: response regulator transcription factor [Flavobacteriales bacterium]|nr:response regulator transcription factor [Flavobacteriales bacterium]